MCYAGWVAINSNIRRKHIVCTKRIGCTNLYSKVSSGARFQSEIGKGNASYFSRIYPAIICEDGISGLTYNSVCVCIIQGASPLEITTEWIPDRKIKL